eukprot:TRINITY_DN12075_c0_g1_i1.p1 TRINITY_DN12075_c0_g1~~TRINITY_DN12075_c0_g1_i1.p1  ORF type:complete len:328 (-),score=30.98 TRINITY_DN12075_c0_g1_i1:175-1158(-)
MTEVGWSKVGSLERETSGFLKEIETRDLLGGGLDFRKESDQSSGWGNLLDLKHPAGKVNLHQTKDSFEGERHGFRQEINNLCGWENLHHLKCQSEKVSLCETKESFEEDKHDSQSEVLQDLNYPPPQEAYLKEHNFFAKEREKARLDLNLNAGGSAQGFQEWQSVCTLDRVKEALERAASSSPSKRKRPKAYGGFENKEGNSFFDLRTKNSSSSSSDIPLQNENNDNNCSSARDPSPSSCSTSKSNINNNTSPSSPPRNGSASEALLAAGCPRCLLYVLLPRTNPKCPRCGCIVFDDFLSFSNKKPRSLQDSANFTSQIQNPHCGSF